MSFYALLETERDALGIGAATLYLCNAGHLLDLVICKDMGMF